MLWERIPETQGVDRASTYYELSARIYARGQYDEALALAETARDIYAELGTAAPREGLAQTYSAIGYNLNQLKRMNEAANAMSKAVELLRENKGVNGGSRQKSMRKQFPVWKSARKNIS